MSHILIICTANICRSPLAEGVLRDRLAKKGFKEWVVSSAGTWAMQVRGASTNSVIVMEQAQIDISNHQSRMVDDDMLKAANLVICMESNHAEALRAEFPDQAHKIYMLTEMVGRRYNITDPYGGPLEEYQRMGRDVTELIDEGFDKIVALAQGDGLTSL